MCGGFKIVFFFPNAYSVVLPWIRDFGTGFLNNHLNIHRSAFIFLIVLSTRALHAECASDYFEPLEHYA